jgi:hypothetical protein
MGQLEPQDDQGDDDPVGEDQLVIRTGAGGPQALASTALVQVGLLLGPSRLGQLDDEFGQMTARDTGADTMRQGRAGPW